MTAYENFLDTQVEVPDRKSICPDRPRQNISMSRPPKTERTSVRTFVPSKNFYCCSCVQKCLCPDFRAFKIIYDQNFVRFKPKFVRSILKNLFVHVQTIVRSKTTMSRLSCGQKFQCVLLAFKSAYVQTIVRSKLPMSRLSCVHSYVQAV